MRNTAARTAGVAGVAIAGLVLAGCAGGDGGTGGGEFSGTTLEVSATWSGTEQSSFEAVLDVFEEQTGALVNYTSFGDNGATTLNTQVGGGEPPDIAVVGQPALMQQLATDGHLAALEGDVADAVTANFAQDWIDLGSVDGTLYGVWFKAANKSTVWYNADVYDEAGAGVPEDWDDFLDQLQIVSDAGYYGITIGADIGWPLTDWFENVYLRTAGGDMYDQLTNHEIPWTDPSVAEALEVLGTLWGTPLVQPGADQRTFDESIPPVFGSNPESGTVYEGDFVAGLMPSGGAVVGENALFYDFPSINGSEPAVVGAGDVAIAFNDNEATMALMAFLASPEAAEVWVQRGGLTSPNQNVDTGLYPDDTARQIAEALVSAETFRFDMSDLTPSAFGGTVGQGFWQIMIEFLQNPSDVAGVQQKLEDAAVAAYGG